MLLCKKLIRGCARRLEMAIIMVFFDQIITMILESEQVVGQQHIHS